MADSTASSASQSDGSAKPGGITPDRAVIDLRKLLESSNQQIPAQEFAAIEENPLKGYSNVTYAWTLVPISPNDLNALSSDGSLPKELTNVVLSSGGRFDKQRVSIYVGSPGLNQPEYFINNVEIYSFATPTRLSGLSGNLTINFDVIEPYSLGMFMQSLQVAALKLNYTNYVECPWLLKLQFFGTDGGGRQVEIPGTSRDYPIKLQQISFTANEGGSKYIVKCLDFNLEAFNNIYGSFYSSINIQGANVGEVITALDSVLNNDQKAKKDDGLIAIPDSYKFEFAGKEADKIKDSKFANVSQQPSPSGSKTQNTQNETAVTRAAPAPGTRAFPFAKQERGIRIVDVIEEVMKSSEYCTNALKPENITKKGYVKWYRITAKLEYKGNKFQLDAIQNRPAYNITYYIKPYLVHHSNFKIPSEVSKGFQPEDIPSTIKKKYQYLYTGQNDDILRWELKFDNTFYTAMSAQGYSNQRGAIDAAGKTITPEETGGNQPGTNTVGLTQLTSAGRLLASHESYKSPMGGGTVDNVPIRVARAFERSLLLDTEMITLDLTILGDPYYLSKSGVFIDKVAPTSAESQINTDGTMASEDIEIRVYLSFKSPIDGPLMGRSFYEFPAAGFTDSPYSGLYRVRTVKSRFNDGVFTQELSLFRDRGQQTEELRNRRQDPFLQQIGLGPAIDPVSRTVNSSVPNTIFSRPVLTPNLGGTALPPLESNASNVQGSNNTSGQGSATVDADNRTSAVPSPVVETSGGVNSRPPPPAAPFNKTEPQVGKVPLPDGINDDELEQFLRSKGY